MRNSLKRLIFFSFIIYNFTVFNYPVSGNHSKVFGSHCRANLLTGQLKPHHASMMHRSGSLSIEKFAMNGKITLSLTEILRLAVANSLDVQLERYDVMDSEQGIFQAKAIFEPLWNQYFSSSRDTTPSPSVFQGVGSAVNKETLYQSTLSKPFSTGTLFKVDLQLKKFETNNIFFLVNPSYDTTWTLSITQHFLRGFGSAVTREPILIAKWNGLISKEAFRMKLESVVLNVEELYWDILGAVKDLKVQEDFLKLAVKTRDDVASSVEVGSQPELNLYKAKAEVAKRREALIKAKTVLKNLKQRLLTYLTPESRTSILKWDIKIKGSEPEMTEAPVTPEEALRIAFKNRPEICQALAGLQINQIELTKAKNNLKPTFDVTGSYFQHGMKGAIPDLSNFPFNIPPETSEILRRSFGGGVWDSLNNAFNGKYNGFKIEFNLRIPLGNMDARAAYQRSEIAMKKQKALIESTKQKVLLDVQSSYNNLVRDRAVIVAAQEAEFEAEKNLEGEQAKYDAGVVVIRDLLEAQRDLAYAKSSLSQARIQYRKSMLEYYHAMGKLLDKSNISVIRALNGSISK